MFRQCLQQFAAAIDKDVSPRLLLQLRHLFRDVPLQKRAIPWKWLFKSARRNKLRKAIHSNSEFAFRRFHRGPGRRKALEGFSAEEEGITREELILLVCGELVVEVTIRPATER